MKEFSQVPKLQQLTPSHQPYILTTNQDGTLVQFRIFRAWNQRQSGYPAVSRLTPLYSSTGQNFPQDYHQSQSSSYCYLCWLSATKRTKEATDEHGGPSNTTYSTHTTDRPNHLLQHSKDIRNIPPQSRGLTCNPMYFPWSHCQQTTNNQQAQQSSPVGYSTSTAEAAIQEQTQGCQGYPGVNSDATRRNWLWQNNIKKRPAPTRKVTPLPGESTIPTSNRGQEQVSLPLSLYPD